MSAFSARLLTPGVALMRRLRLSFKLAGISAAILLPLAWLAVTDFARARQDLAIVRAEASGAQVAQSIIDLASLLQLHRDQTLRAAPREATARQVQDAVRALDAAIAQRPELALADAWKPLRDASTRAVETTAPAGRAATYKTHADLVAGLQGLLQRNGETSFLLFDPQPATFFLMDLLVERYLPWTELISQMRAADATESGRVATQAELLRVQTATLQAKLAALERAGAPTPQGWAGALAAVEAFTRSSAGPLDATAQFERASAALAAATVFRNAAAQDLQALLAAREQRLARQSAVSLALTALGACALLYLMACFYLATLGSLRAMSKGVVTVGKGDLSGTMDVRGQDEFATMGRELEGMANSLSAIVAAVRSDASLVGSAGERVSATSRSLARRTEQQVSSLQQTTTAVREISTTVARNAQAVRDADDKMQRVRHVGEASGASMAQAVQTMSDIEASAAKVAEIVSSIDAIAFRTNLLALNAAVEAARAGQHGKGFAVVAAEVRQLAQRAAASAGEIRTLIAASRADAQEGAARVRAIAAEMSQLVDGVREVGDQLRSVAQASSQQSAQLEQVTNAVGDLDQLTQGNASAVKAAATTAEELMLRSNSLAKAVSHVRLRQGSADEARAFVDRAVALIAQQGWGSAHARMHEPGNAFVDRDLYVFAFDRNGVYRAFTSNTAKNGTALSSVPGLDAAGLVRDAWAVCDADGSGWVDYDIVNPTTGAVMPKTSYVAAISKELLVGCGVYRTTARKQTAPARALLAA